MACHRYTGAITDHALGSPLGTDAAAHLASCTTCKARLEDQERVLATIDAAVAEIALTAPSPHFVSRLRAHVTDRSGQSSPSTWWIPATIVAAALVAAVAIVATRLPRELRARPPAPGNPAASVAGVAPAEPPVDRSSPALAGRTTRHTRGERRAVRAQARAIPVAEVLVPGEQRQAVGRLFESLRAGRPEAVSILMNLHSADAVSEARGVTIAPLRIEPVVVPAMPVTVSLVDKPKEWP
jgi:hypothetical protein